MGSGRLDHPAIHVETAAETAGGALQASRRSCVSHRPVANQSFCNASWGRCTRSGSGASATSRLSPLVTDQKRYRAFMSRRTTSRDHRRKSTKKRFYRYMRTAVSRPA